MVGKKNAPLPGSSHLLWPVRVLGFIIFAAVSKSHEIHSCLVCIVCICVKSILLTKAMTAYWLNLLDIFKFPEYSMEQKWEFKHNLISRENSICVYIYTQILETVHKKEQAGVNTIHSSCYASIHKKMLRIFTKASFSCTSLMGIERSGVLYLCNTGAFKTSPISMLRLSTKEVHVV